MTIDKAKKVLKSPVKSKDDCLTFSFDFKNELSGLISILDSCEKQNFSAEFEIEESKEGVTMKIFPLDFDWKDEQRAYLNLRLPFDEAIDYLSTKSVSYKNR